MFGGGPIGLRWLLLLLELVGGSAQPVTLVPGIGKDSALLAVATQPDDGGRRLAFWCRNARARAFECFARVTEDDRLIGEHAVFDDPLAHVRVARHLSLRSDAAWLSGGRALLATVRFVSEPDAREVAVQFVTDGGKPVSPSIVVAGDIEKVVAAQVQIAPDAQGGAWVYWNAGEVLWRRYVDADGKLPAESELVGDGIATGPRIAGDTLITVEEDSGRFTISVRSGAARETLGRPEVVQRTPAPYHAVEAARAGDGTLFVLWTTGERGCAIEGVAMNRTQRKAIRIAECPSRWTLAGGERALVAWAAPDGRVLAEELREEPLRAILGTGFDRGDNLPALRLTRAPDGYDLHWRQQSRFASRRITSRPAPVAPPR